MPAPTGEALPKPSAEKMMAEAAVTVTPAFLLAMKTHVLDTEKPSVNKDAILIVLEDPKSPDRQD